MTTSRIDSVCYDVACGDKETIRRACQTNASLGSHDRLDILKITEVMLALWGKNVSGYDDDERQVHCKVHVVSEYKHLGTWVSLRLKLCERCQAQGGSGDGVVLAIGYEGLWQ